MAVPTTAQYRTLHPFLQYYILLTIASGFVGIVLVVAQRYATGFFAIASAVLFRFALRRAIRRRHLVDTTFFRPCRLPWFGTWLLWNRSYVDLVRWASVACGLVASWYDYSTTLGRFLSCLLLALFPTLLLFAATVSLAKFHIDTDFRIVVFRKNRAPYNRQHKAELMPACGLFGQVLLIEEASLREIWEGGRLRLDQWILSEMYQPLTSTDASVDWRDIVLTELAFADFVVFDWSGELTENMRWEMTETLERVPIHRWLLIASTETASLVLGALSSSSRSEVVTVQPLTDDYAVHAFRLALASKFLSLRPEPRTAHCA